MSRDNAYYQFYKNAPLAMGFGTSQIFPQIWSCSKSCYETQHMPNFLRYHYDHKHPSSNHLLVLSSNAKYIEESIHGAKMSKHCSSDHPSSTWHVFFAQFLGDTTSEIDYNIHLYSTQQKKIENKRNLFPEIGVEILK